MSRSAPDPIDVHVANRLRIGRQLRGISQTALGAEIGVSFQQVGKYEKAKDRVSASRLYQCAKVLDVPVEYFFVGL